MRAVPLRRHRRERGQHVAPRCPLVAACWPSPYCLHWQSSWQRHPTSNQGVIVDRVRSELAEHRDRTFLVIDDLHELTSPDALAQLTRPTGRADLTQPARA